MSTNTAEDISNAASGHKANLSNPNTSEESKANSRQELEKLGGEDAFYGKNSDTNDIAPGNPGNVIGGLKANIAREDRSEESKEESRQKLQEMGESA